MPLREIFGDNNEIIKSLGNPQSIENYTVDDYTAGYAYSYKGDTVCKEKNIKYELEQNGVVWPVYKLSVCSELNGEIRNYHLIFRTDFGTEYLYDILYYAPGY